MSEDESIARVIATFDLLAVQRRLDELDVIIPKLVAERDGLRAVTTFAGDGRFGRVSDPTTCAPSSKVRTVYAHSHRTMVRTVLEEANRPLGVREIIDEVERRFQATLERTSVSPLLRKMAGKGEVVHDPATSKWRSGQVETDRSLVEGGGPPLDPGRVAGRGELDERNAPAGQIVEFKVAKEDGSGRAVA